MCKNIFFSIAAFASVFLSGCSAPADPKWEIQQIMNKQAEAWTNKDLDGFMEPYWQSDSLRFIGQKGVVLGWASTLARYKKSYPPEKMGTLIFNDLHFEILSDEAAWVDGQWTLLLPDKNAIGRFSLLWKKQDGKWQIFADHST
ncbi:MAG: hypothetical protein RLZZ205_862 [Bacteroidota bacterium]